MRQFSFRQGAFAECPLPEFFQTYPLNLTIMTVELARLLRSEIMSTDIVAVPGSDCIAEYVFEVQGTWPISEVPPSGPLFSEAGSSKRAQTSSDH